MLSATTRVAKLMVDGTMVQTLVSRNGELMLKMDEMMIVWIAIVRFDGIIRWMAGIIAPKMMRNIDPIVSTLKLVKKTDAVMSRKR